MILNWRVVDCYGHCHRLCSVGLLGNLGTVAVVRVELASQFSMLTTPSQPYQHTRRLAPKEAIVSDSLLLDRVTPGISERASARRHRGCTLGTTLFVIARKSTACTYASTSYPPSFLKGGSPGAIAIGQSRFATNRPHKGKAF